MFAIAGLIAAPVFIDLNKYKQDFSAVIKNFTGVEPVIEGGVRVSFFPYPSITIGSINIPNIEGATSPNILSADGVEAKFTFTSLFNGKFDPSSIMLLRPRIELEVMENGDKNWTKLFEKKDAGKTNEALNIPLNIVINNGNIIYRTKTKRVSVDYITSDIKVDSAHGPFAFAGNFIRGTATVNFKGKIGSLDNNSDAELNIYADSFDFGMKGSYRPGSNFDIHGTSSLNIKNLGSFVDSFFSEEPLLAMIKSTEKLDVKGEFLISKEITSFNKLSIESESVKGGGSIDLLYGAGRQGESQWDISLNINKVNIDSLLAEKEKPKIENPDLVNYYTAGAGAVSLASYRFAVPVDISALFALSVDEIIYNGDKISNILIDTDIFNGKAIIHSFSAELPGNSKIEFLGNIDHNGSRPLFTGKIRAYGDNLRAALNWLYPQYNFIPENELKEFLFSCDFNITPRKMTVSNIYGSVDKTLLNGSIFVRPSDTVPSIKADIKLDRMDFDKYNATKQIDDYVRALLIGAKDVNLDTSWLKLFNYNLALSVSGDEIVYNGNEIRKISATIGAAKGLMAIQNFSVDSNVLDLQGKFNINLNKEVPSINIDITSKNFNTAAFIIGSDTDDKQNAEGTQEESIWSKDEFNLMGIGRFGGALNLSIGNFKHNKTNLTSINLQGELKKDIFSINDFKVQWGPTGNIRVKGSLGVSKEAPSIGISIVASELNIQDVLQAMGSENTITGKIYLGGVIKTFGVSPYDWVKEIKTTAKFAMRDVDIKGIDLSAIIEQSRKLYSVIDMDVAIKNALKTGGTKFIAIDGNLTTDKSILQAKDFSIATDTSRGVFVGNLSLHNMEMKGLAKISYLPEINKKVTLTFNLEGAIPDNVSYKMDSSNLEQYITSKANRSQ